MSFRNLICLIAVLAITGVSTAADIANFDDLTLAPESYWNGSDYSGGFTSGSANFNNSFTDWGGGITSWAGFAYSNIPDSATPGYDGQYNAITGGAHSGNNYAIGYLDTYSGVTPTMTLDTATVVEGLYVTNTNYAYYFIINGDSYFGKDPYGEGDWFLMTIIGKDAAGSTTGTTEIYLADYTDGKTDVLDSWGHVDTSLPGEVKSLEFAVSTNRPFTPLYFATDTVVPEPATLVFFILGGILLRCRRIC